MQGSRNTAAQRVLPELADLPEGFRYVPELVDPRHEQSIIRDMRELEFAPFQFHGFEGKRRVVSFGWRYDFNGGGLKKADNLPAFLLPVRDAAAAAFGIESASLEQALCSNTRPVRRLAGTATVRCSETSSASRCFQCARSGYAGRPELSGSAARSPPSRAPHTFCKGQRAKSGSTAFRPSLSCATRLRFAAS